MKNNLKKKKFIVYVLYGFSSIPTDLNCQATENFSCKLACWKAHLAKGCSKQLLGTGNRTGSAWLCTEKSFRLYLPFSDWFWIKRTSVWFQINQKMVYTIWFRFDLIRFLCVSKRSGRNHPRYQLGYRPDNMYYVHDCKVCI